ncbi:hypothetical protein FOL47_011393 [Perkinsus chesapeaki]|uniref:Uncharacterized protein n=1 Tax=Perkinsus chesapeaki TaxID=330153 RepID=A0A7J6KZH7_PERCH|nr:hypothetical protein FOL47_011393 [Perkinsus chesapeaki]
MPSTTLLASLVAISIAWQFPTGRYDGSAQDPYISVTCFFEDDGHPGISVYLEAQCDPHGSYATSKHSMRVTRNPADPKGFVLTPAEKASSDFLEFIDELNQICPGRGFIADDFSEFTVTSTGRLEIREESRQVTIKKAGDV